MRRSQGDRQSGEYEPYDERILGSGEFVESLWRETESRKMQISKITLDDIIQKAARLFGVDVELLRQRNRLKDLVDVRAIICYLAVRGDC